jgi:hypothetical protein
MNSKRNSQERITRAQISPKASALRTDSTSHFDENVMMTSSSATSPKHMVEISKMRRLNDARREWEQRHCSNSPFRINNYGSSSSIGLDTQSCEGSPMPVNRSYGLRATIAKGDQYMATSQAPVNLTNK